MSKSKSDTQFSSDKLAQVLSHYDIGATHLTEPFSAGSKRTSKMVIISEQGKFLLKSRPKSKDSLCRVEFAHAVHNHLAKKGFPVTSLVATNDDSTSLQLDNHIYEIFRFASGARYDGTVEATIDAGRQLAGFHLNLADFACKSVTVGGRLKDSFHDSANVRRHLKTLGTNRRIDANRKLQKTVEALMSLYNGSGVHVNELGFDSWDRQVVHGDWHPGNMLFSHGRLIAVLDFDSVKIAPPVTDLANGMLQFSIVSSRPNPADWPDYLDQAKLVQFLSGYRQVIEMDKNKLNSLPCLMIETIIAEAVLPVATTGFFGNLSGADFLRMIQRKADWIDKNRRKLTEAIKA